MTRPPTTPSTSRSRFTRQERFPALDGLRALAVTLVFFFHALPYGDAISPHVRAWRDHLDVGVEIFFVLSGFLVYRPFAAAHLAGGSAPSVTDYVRRRGLRIYPAYMFALTAHVALDRGFVVSVGDYFAHLTLTHFYLPYRAGFGIAQSWTLVAEVTFYALVPLWAALARAAGRRIGAPRAEIGGALLVVAAGVVLRQFQRYHALSALYPIGVALPTLGFGMLLTAMSLRAGSAPRLGDRLRRLTRAAAPWWAAAAGVYLWLTVLPFGENDAADRLRQDLMQAVVAALLVTPCVFGRQGALRSTLGRRPFAYLALVSYGVYLWHPRILHEVARHDLGGSGVLGGVATVVIGAVISVAAGALSWHLLERPILRRTGHERPRAAAARTAS